MAGSRKAAIFPPMKQQMRIAQAFAAPRRAGLVLLLLVALLMPRVSGVLVDLLPGFDRAVICTGSEMIVLTLDQDGQPVTLHEGAGETCLRAPSTPVLAQHLPVPYHALFGTIAPFAIKCDLLAPQASLQQQKDKRGPPLLI